MVKMLKPEKKSRPGLRHVAIPAFLWLALFSFGGYQLMTFGGPHYQIRGNGRVHEHDASVGAGSLGSARRDMLEKATHHYIETHPDAPAAMIEGKQLAPVDWLNEELEHENAKFRVRSIHGKEFETFEVS